MLRDPARFAFSNVSGAHRVKQSGLAVIDVAHDSDHRRTRHSFRTLFAAFDCICHFFRGLLFEGDDLGVGSEEARHFSGELGIKRLIDRGENPFRQEARD